MKIKTINNRFLQIIIKSIPSTERIDLLISDPMDAKKIIKSLRLSDLSIRESWIHKLSGIVSLLFLFIKVFIFFYSFILTLIQESMHKMICLSSNHYINFISICFIFSYIMLGINSYIICV